MEKKLNICVVQPNNAVYSETFIRNHIEQLPASVINTYGPWWPEFDGQHRSLSRKYLHRNIFSKILVYGVKLLPQFIFTRLPATITGFPLRNEELLKCSFKYYLKKNKTDVVLAEYGMKGVIVNNVCKELNIPLVVHFHGYDAHHRSILEEFGAGYREMFNNAAAIISVSEYMQNALLQMSAPADKLHLIHYGVNTNLFKQVDLMKTGPVLVTVGRFEDTKAPYLTILAFAEAVKKVPDAKLIMIGEGSLLESSKTLAITLGLHNNIEFKGIQSPEQVASMMQQARAFVLHSIVTGSGDAEGTPNVILEACSTGIPVISTLHAGIPDVIEHGVSGFLVKEKDTTGMANYMVQLLTERELASIMGASGRERVLKHFELKDQIGKLMNIILKAVS